MQKNETPLWQYVAGAVFVRLFGWGAIIVLFIGAACVDEHSMYQPAPPSTATTVVSTTTTTVTHYGR